MGRHCRGSAGQTSRVLITVYQAAPPAPGRGSTSFLPRRPRLRCGSKRTYVAGRRGKETRCASPLHLARSYAQPTRLLLALFLLAVASLSPAFAIDPAYLGYWAENAQTCTYHDAFDITPERRTAREEDCRTKEAHKEGGGGWVLRLQCGSEGFDSTVTLHWRLGPDGRLPETQKGQTTAYVRCSKLTR